MVERTKGALNPEKEDLLNWSRIWRDSHVSNGVNIKPLLLKICFQQKFSFFSIFQQNELESTRLIPPLKFFDNEVISKNSFWAKKLLIQSKQMKLHLRLALLNKEVVEKLPKNLLMISSWVQPAPLKTKIGRALNSVSWWNWENYFTLLLYYWMSWC